MDRLILIVMLMLGIDIFSIGNQLGRGNPFGVVFFLAHLFIWVYLPFRFRIVRFQNLMRKLTA
jgi:hypothetical protein